MTDLSTWMQEKAELEEVMAAVTLMPELPSEMAVDMITEDGTIDVMTGSAEVDTTQRPKKLP